MSEQDEHDWWCNWFEPALTMFAGFCLGLLCGFVVAFGVAWNLLR